MPRTEHITRLPPANTFTVESSGLTHLMRALYLLHSERYEAAVADLRLAAVYDEHSPFMHEKLAGALLATARGADAETVLNEGLADSPQDAGLNLLAGQLDLEGWDYAAAVVHLQTAAADDTTMAAAAAPLIDALLWQRRHDDAEEAARDLMERAPGDSSLSVSLGAAFEDHERLAPARDAYRQARVQQPADRQAALGEMRACLLMGDPNGAAMALLPLAAYYPDEPDLSAHVARLAREAGRADAEALRQIAMARTEGDPAGRLVLASGEAMAGQQDSAVKLLRQSLQANPEHTPTRLFLAELLQEQNDPVGALKILQPIASAPPSVWRSRARLHTSLGNIDALLEDMGHALQPAADVAVDAAAVFDETARLLLQLLPPPQARARGVAFLNRQAGRMAAAEAALARAGMAEALGDTKTALGELRALAHGNPDDAATQLRLADTLARAGQSNEAITILEGLVHDDPTDPTRLNALGFTLADAGRRLPEAAVFVRRAFRLAADDAMVTDSLGWLLLRQGRAAAAVIWLTRAHITAPDDAEVARHLGDALVAVGRRAQARSIFQKALRLAPSAALRRQLEQRMRAR